MAFPTRNDSTQEEENNHHQYCNNSPNRVQQLVWRRTNTTNQERAPAVVVGGAVASQLPDHVDPTTNWTTAMSSNRNTNDRNQRRRRKQLQSQPLFPAIFQFSTWKRTMTTTWTGTSSRWCYCRHNDRRNNKYNHNNNHNSSNKNSTECLRRIKNINSHHCRYSIYSVFKYMMIGYLLVVLVDVLIEIVPLVVVHTIHTTTSNSSSINRLRHNNMKHSLHNDSDKNDDDDDMWELCDPFLLYHQHLYLDRNSDANQKTKYDSSQSIWRLLVSSITNHHDHDETCFPNYQQQQGEHAEIYYKIYNPLPTMKRYIVCPSSSSSIYEKTNIILTIEPNSNVTISSTTLFATCNISSNNILLLQPSRVFPFDPMIPIPDTNDIDQEQHPIYKIIPPIRTRFGVFRIQENLFPQCNIPCYYDGEPQSNRYIEPIDYIDSDKDLATKLEYSDPITYSNNHDGHKSPIWTIEFSMEGPQYWSSIYINETHWHLYNRFWSTTSYQSEIPIPYYSYELYPIYHNNYVPFHTGIRGASFIATNCFSKNNREQIVQDMIQIIANNMTTSVSNSNTTTPTFRIDSIGYCLRNAVPPYNISNTLENKNHIMQQYMFYLAFENQNENDYITEKLWGAYYVGTIPIYYGAPNIKDHVPRHSLIHVNEYNSTYELVQHLIDISNNRTLYESYHQWRTEPIPYHFIQKYNMTQTHITCRTCRWAYARMYGTGWNHTTQSIQPLQGIGSKRVCLSQRVSLPYQANISVAGAGSGRTTKYLIQHPFIETWLNMNGTELLVKPISTTTMDTIDEEMKTTESNYYIDHDSMKSVRWQCQHELNDTNRKIDIHNGTIQRTLYNHDGVIDMILQQPQQLDRRRRRRRRVEMKNTSTTLAGGVILQLQFPYLEPPIVFRWIRNGVYHVQSDQLRYTILLASSSSLSLFDNNTNHDDDVVKWIVDETTVQITIVDTKQQQQHEEQYTLLLLPLRIRIIVEDIDTFHKGADRIENYYGSIMTNDFLNPIQIYYQKRKRMSARTVAK